MVGVDRTKAPMRPAEMAGQLRVAVWRAARRMRHVSDVEISPTLHSALGSVEAAAVREAWAEVGISLPPATAPLTMKAGGAR